jgi:hypothetical protein
MTDAKPTINECSPKLKLLESNEITGDLADSGVVSLGRCWGKKVIDLIGWLSIYTAVYEPADLPQKEEKPIFSTIILQAFIIQSDYFNIYFLNVRQASIWGSVSWKVDLTQILLPNTKPNLLHPRSQARTCSWNCVVGR